MADPLIIAQQIEKIRTNAVYAGVDPDRVISAATIRHRETDYPLTKALDEEWELTLREAILDGDVTLLDRLPAEGLPGWYKSMPAAQERLRKAAGPFTDNLRALLDRLVGRRHG